MVELVWAVGTRSGSEFAIELSDAAGAGRYWPRLKVNAAREVRYRDQDPYVPATLDEVLAAVSRPEVKAVKLEEPSLDGWLNEILAAHPSAKVVGTHRPLAATVRSHLALRETWGFTPEKVLQCYAGRLAIYERLAAENRIFLVDPTRPDIFNMRRFADYLGLKPTAALRKFVEGWPVVNDLDALRSHPQYATSHASRPDDIPDMPGAKELAERYQALMLSTNRPSPRWWHSLFRG